MLFALAFYSLLWLDLREAQLYILNYPDQIRGLLKVEGEMLERTSPEFWAAFQLSGDWR
ncbi:hypothetical protein [Rubinisphaera brasiliensis]|uniref:Uncharacterized protein n=1 Tax=Rubinisphaera brasiliensis (strain ATCC 49424 / DSM 5305 / JCM 21570 / IAM 15109 / NBRC 103401 / IFAM 1448) TaxID=756272 RepID=F0SR47_RUBBR|nr:hypothetical protein [Rubinisphaera brasiliensis]ADY61294.1 hypothetical protein Plabr_3701 [Rubinisphaera brasiliensis DSM 5305]